MGASLAEKGQTTERFNKSVIAYEPAFDANDYGRLHSTFSGDAECSLRRRALDRRTRRQLETHIGERLNVLLSKTRYEIRNGMIYEENALEPFMKTLVRGRDYRRARGNPLDWPREQAEVEGFKTIQQVLCSPDTPEGIMMLSISPPGSGGSVYQHNFYDIFTLRQDHRGRHIEARRYSSALTNGEYAAKTKKLTPESFLPTNAYFLSHPILINPAASLYKTPDDIHRYLHRGHECMGEEEFRRIRQVCAPLIESYTDALCKNPDDRERQILIFNAILNKADQTARNLRKKREGAPREIERYDYPHAPTSELLQREIYRLGRERVRPVTTGCGLSGGFSVNDPLKTNPGNLLTNSGNLPQKPFRVSEFGALPEDKYGSREVRCPRCNKISLRPKNQLLSSCQHCGSKSIAC